MSTKLIKIINAIKLNVKDSRFNWVISYNSSSFCLLHICVR